MIITWNKITTTGPKIPIIKPSNPANNPPTRIKGSITGIIPVMIKTRPIIAIIKEIRLILSFDDPLIFFSTSTEIFVKKSIGLKYIGSISI